MSMLLGISAPISTKLEVLLLRPGVRSTAAGTSSPLSTDLSVSPPSTRILPAASALFHRRATSSSTFSPAPESRQSAPHLRPTNWQSSANASDLSVRLCFFVNTRKAIGRRTASGISTARTRGGGGAGLPRSGADDDGGSGTNGSLVSSLDGGAGACRKKDVSAVFGLHGGCGGISSQLLLGRPYSDVCLADSESLLCEKTRRV